MINLKDFKKSKYEEYKKEVDAVVDRFSGNEQAIEAAISNDSFRHKLGLESDLDPFLVLGMASVDGMSIQKEIKKLNEKYGYPGDKVHPFYKETSTL